MNSKYVYVGLGVKGRGIGHLMYINHIENLGIYFLFDI